MTTNKILPAIAAMALLMPALAQNHATPHATPPKSVRLYVFDCGSIKGLDPAIFHFKKEDGAPVSQGISTVTKPLLPQLAAVGYTPADMTYLGLSHYHSDHTANANSFAGATWLVHQTERDAMFAEKPAGIIQQASFSELKNSKTIVLKEQDYDVFGDGTVIIKYTPGHTPGHQVLFLKLRKTGPVLVAGDLYHYPEERNSGKTPTFEFNAEQSLASRAAIEDFLKKSKAQLWIEHDAITFKKLKKAPEYYE